MGKRFFYALILTLITADSLFATPTERRVRIGVVANFSEISSSTSNPYFGHISNGIELAIEEKSNLLKKNNISIEVVRYDYGGKKENIFNIVEQIKKDKIQFLYGFIYSSHALLGAQLLKHEDVLILNSTATATRLGKFENFMRTSFSDDQQGLAISKLAKKNKVKNVAIFSVSNCSYCQSLSGTFQANFMDEDHTIVYKQSSLNTHLEIDKFYTAIKGKSIDAIIVPNHELDSANIISALIKKGVDVTWYGGDGWGNFGILFNRIVNDKKFKGYSISHWHPEADIAKSLDFFKRYKSKYKLPPVDTSALSYEGFSILLDAFLKSKSISPAQIKLSLMNNTFEGLLGEVDWQDSNTPKKSIVFTYWSPYQKLLSILK